MIKQMFLLKEIQFKKIGKLILVVIFLFSFAWPGKIFAVTVTAPTTDSILSRMYADNQRIIAILTGTLPGTQNDKLNPSSTSNLLKIALKRVLRQLTQEIVNWIDRGFEGNPAFITNTRQFFQDTVDITIGDFLINDPSLDFLCDPFKIQVKLALGLQYRPFREQIECSFTEALGNTEQAMNSFLAGNFIEGGGWDSWLQITTVPQNNQMGAMMIAQGELDDRIQKALNIKESEADWGNGFMSWKDCPPDTTTEKPDEAALRDKYAYITNQERGDDGCVIKTPGGVIANKINWVDTSTLRELELSDDINAIVNSLANALITEGLNSIKGKGLLGDTKLDYEDNYNSFMSYLSTIDTDYGGGSNNGGYNSDGSINFNQTFANKATALETINTQLNIENQFFIAQQNIYNLLDTMQNITNASVCSSDVKNEIITRITGEFSGLKEPNWNKKDAAEASVVATSNISALSSAKTAVESATNDSTIPGIVQPLTTMQTFHSATQVNSYSYSPMGTGFSSIKNWIQSKVNNNKACLGDISGLSSWGIE